MSNIAVGIDIGGTITKIGLVQKDGKLLAKRKINTRDYSDIAQFIDAVYVVVNELSHVLALPLYKFAGIGVGVPNGNSLTGSIHHAVNLPWSGKIPLAEMLKSKFNLPVWLDNDANVAAVAERILGDAHELDDFAVITVGTGLGSGIFSRGRLLTGKTGMAGELGHTILYPDGRPCTCGNKGCVEAYVSARGFIETYGEISKNSISTIIPEEIVKKAKKGDSLARKAIERMGYDLGMALANLVNILSLEAIFLTGGLMNEGEIFLHHVEEGFRQNVLSIFRETCSIRLSNLRHAEGGILGGASLVFQSL